MTDIITSYFDTVMFIVATLAILVTVLLAFQIIQTVNFNKEKKNFEEKYKQFEKEFNDKLNYIKTYSNLISQLGQNEAVRMIANINEIIEITKSINEKGRTILYITESTPTESNPYFHISVYENTTEHATIIGRFKVNIGNKVIYKQDIATDNYIIVE